MNAVKIFRKTHRFATARGGVHFPKGTLEVVYNRCRRPSPFSIVWRSESSGMFDDSCMYRNLTKEQAKVKLAEIKEEQGL